VLASGAHLTLNSDGTFVYDPFGAFDYLPAAGSGASNLTATDSFTYKLTGGGTATVTITISGLDSDDTLIGTAGNDIMDGGIGADIFLVGQGGADTVQGGDGDDTFRFGSRLTAADQVTGGTGDDRIILNGDYSAGVVFGATTMSQVESIRLIDGHDYTLTTNDANVAAGETLGVFGGTLGAGDDLTFDGSAETDGRFEIHAGAGTDTLTGGAGSDDFLFFDTFTAADKVNGGGGSDDRLILNGDYSGGVVFGATTMTGIETIRLTSGHDYTLTTNDANVAADKTLAVRGSTLVSGDNLNFDGSAETNGKFDLHGGAGADTLKSGAKADALDGGAGVDALTGGSGRDTFTFHIGEAAGDTITDFDGNGANPGDRIEFVGYGVGATFNQINATQWEVVSGDTLTHEIINFSNSAAIDASDYTFI
jgi:VCBS repeat-containing protein